MQRRRFLKSAVVGAAALSVAAAGGGAWLAGEPGGIAGFADLAAARRWLDTLANDPRARTTRGWPLAQVLEHAAQSVGFSLSGFPASKPALFQHTAGALAFAAFNRRGAMHHGLEEPIPGAPALVAGDVAAAAHRLAAMLDAFEAHTGPLAPHFAYGPLDKPQYTRAHLLHLADHAQLITRA